MKPIEEGCRAVIVSSIIPSNNGKIVEIGKFIGGENGNNFVGDDWWETDIGILTTHNRYINRVRECRLQRIDDYDGNETTSWEELKVIWSPPREIA